MRHFWMIATISKVFVENLQKHPQNSIPTVVLFCLAIDVEEDNLRLSVCHSP